MLTRRLTRSAITVIVLVVAWVLAFQFRFEFAVPDTYRDVLVATLVPVVALKYGLLSLLRANRHAWRHTSLDDVVTIATALVGASMIVLGVRILVVEMATDSLVADLFTVPVGVVGIDLALSVLGVAGVRGAWRLRADGSRRRRAEAATSRRRVVLVGAGWVGDLVVREVRSRPGIAMHLVGFVDDDPARARQVIQGLEVLGSTDDLPELAEALRIDEAIITINDLSGDDARRITDRCRDAGIDVSIVPSATESSGGRISVTEARPVALEDLLGRDPVDLDVTSIRACVAGRPVLVTGAGGSIGAELCRQLARHELFELVLVERSEPALWEIHRALVEDFPGLDVVPCVADVRNERAMDRVFARHRPAAVFHAAAHKHVPMMEDNVGEAVLNNVRGTKVVADRAVAHGVERFVMVSTDKAVSPTSVMGMTKRVAERYVRHLAAVHDRCLVSVRFGNVLGSRGSVVPVFEEQIRRGGPITITHPEMRRYFMTIPEASRLVIQAAAMGRGGEIFVLDMGEPVRIVDLARELVTLSGLRPGEDIAFEYTGIRPGEKLFEEIALDEENAHTTRHPKIFVGTGAEPHWASVDGDLERLFAAARGGDDDVTRVWLRLLVPELE